MGQRAPVPIDRQRPAAFAATGSARGTARRGRAYGRSRRATGGSFSKRSDGRSRRRARNRSASRSGPLLDGGGATGAGLGADQSAVPPAAGSAVYRQHPGNGRNAPQSALAAHARPDDGRGQKV